MKFYGRAAELDALRREIEQTAVGSRLAVVSGRRGVGKTALLLKAARESGRPTLHFLCSRKYAEASLAKDWCDAARLELGLREEIALREPTLSGVIGHMMEASREKPCNLILDACEELDSIAPAFWEDLRQVWDRCRDRSHLWLAICGTDGESMRRISEDGCGPLSEIRDLSLALRPFEPGLLREIFLDLAPQGSAEDLLTLYAVTGGVARYVELLAREAPLTREGLVSFVFSPEGEFLRTEGDAILARDFRLESPVNYGIMREVAAGKSRWAEIAGSQAGWNISGCMSRLENRHGLLKKVAPMFSKSPRGVRFEIADPYLRFWFRFVEPMKCQTLAERNDWKALRGLCLAGLHRFEEETLSAWFRERYAESGRWTRVGRWWDRQGRNEIDLIALNEFDGRFEIAEVKRNPAKIDLGLLRMKAVAFEQAAGRFLKKMGEPRLRGLSLEDMLKEPQAGG